MVNFEPQLVVCDHHVGELSIWLDDSIFRKVTIIELLATFYARCSPDKILVILQFTFVIF